MKKGVRLIAIIFLVLLIQVPALADIMYANGDNVPAFSEQDINSSVLRQFYGGEKILIETYSGNQWAGVLAEDPTGDGQTIAWIPMSALSYTMPPRYCNHQWSDWVVNRQPTCTATGLRTRNCVVCGTNESQDIEKTPHTFGAWTVTRQATCTTEGEVVHSCLTCGYQERTTIEKTGHTFGDWTVIKQATCTAEGERYHKCKVCGQEEHQVLEKLPHSFGDWVVTKDPTCTEEGIRMHRCQVCGFEGTEPVPMLPHDFEWVIQLEATDHSSGIRSSVCRVCGFTQEQVSYDPEGTLRRGDRSEEVREVQQLLADQNYLNASGADGIFGGGTEKALMEFQNDQGLTPDGIAWPQTRKRLLHDFNPWVTITKMTRDTAGERERSCKECSYVQHETVAPQPSFMKGDRGEGVRALQKIMTVLGHDAGSFDGIYGSMLDAAFDGYAKENNMEFTPGIITPSQVDSVMNSWIATIPKEQWAGDGGFDSAVNLALTVTSITGDDDVSIDDGGPALEKAEKEAAAAAPAEGNEAATPAEGSEAPAAPAEGSEAPAAAEPVATVAEPAATVAEPVATVAEPVATVAEPVTTAAEPAAPAEEPAASEEKDAAAPAEEPVAPEEKDAAAPAEEPAASEEKDASAPAEEPAASEEKAEDKKENARIITYNWELTNLGDEECTFVALLLNFGDDQGFLKDNLVMVLDGTVLQAKCGNSVSGSFSISSDWGDGEMNFCALGIEEKTGKEWLSNVNVFDAN